MQQKQKENLLIIILIVISLIAGGNILYNYFYSKQGKVEIRTNSVAANKAPKNNKQENLNKLQEKIVVHIGGEVIKPGVYECKKNSRLYKIINKAGGATNEAALNKVNLAGEVHDEEKIIIPSLIDNNVQANSIAKININTAQQTKLEEIAGVGPVTAEKIIAYRNDNGKFKDIASLANVSGIGPKTIEKIKEKITY